MLSLQQVTRRYRGNRLPAVAGISLAVSEGETLALVGESGSGKTTLLRLIAGLEIPDGGSIELEGRKVADTTGRHWVPPEKRRIGFVFQDGALFPHLTIAANIAYGLSGESKSRRAELTDEILDVVGLNGFQKRFPHQLSGGERQRIAVARAIAPRPKLVLLDEPFSNLDPALRRGLREEIQSILTQVGATSIIVTHDTEDALAVGDRIAVCRSGRIEQIGTPEELYHEPANGYCARLFGPANSVSGDETEPSWVRPERMSFQKNGGYPVVVRRVHHTGRHLEVTVDCLDPKQSEPWIVIADHNRQIVAGDSVFVGIEGKETRDQTGSGQRLNPVE